jgi:circadian clock protein KaiB
VTAADPLGSGPVASPKPAETVELRLYVAGQTSKCLRAMENLRQACDTYLPGQYRIVVVDLLEDPQLAADDQIIAVPTLVRKLPEPMRKIVGDLSDTERLLVGLQVRPWRRTG